MPWETQTRSEIAVICAHLCTESSTAAGGREKWESQRAVTGTIKSLSSNLHIPEHSSIVARGKDDKGEAFQTCSVDKEEGTSHHSPNTHRAQTQGWAPASADEHMWDLLISGTATGLTHLTGALWTPRRGQQHRVVNFNYSAVHGLLCDFFFFSCLSS